MRDCIYPTSRKGQTADVGCRAGLPRVQGEQSGRGHDRQQEGPSDPQLPGFVFRLLVPSIILVLLAVGGLLFYRQRWRVRRAPVRGGHPVGAVAQPGWGSRSSGSEDYLGSAWVLQMPRQEAS